MKYLALCCLVVVLMCNSCSDEPNISTDMDEVIYVRNEGADIPAYVHGNGLSKVFIIMVHGGPGGNGLEYRCGEYSESLERDYAMVYTDQRGQGSSHGHYRASELDIDLMVDDLYGLVRGLKYRYGEDISVFMMGHSWGGTLGTAYMLKSNYQSELKGWIEVDGAHDLPLLNKEAIKMFRRIGALEVASLNNIYRWGDILKFAISVNENNVSISEAGEINGYAHEAEGLLDEVYESESNCQGVFGQLFFSPLNALSSSFSGSNTSNIILEEAETISMTNELDRINIPSLFLWGKYDFVVPPALGETAFEQVSSANKKLVIFENSGHSPMDNESTAFVREVVEFVEEVK